MPTAKLTFMDTVSEKFERLYSDAENNPAGIELFYQEIWPMGPLMATHLHDLIEKMDLLIRSNTPVQQRHLGISTLALALPAYYKGQYESSQRLIAESIKIFSEIQEEDWVKCAQVILGANYRTLGEMELALKYLLPAYEHLLKTTAKKMFLAYCCHNLAGIYADTGQYEEALKYYGQNENAAMEPDMKLLSPITFLGMGVILQRQKKYVQALNYLTRALELADDTGSPITKAVALTDLGSWYAEMGDYTAATAYQEQALSLRNELNIPNGAVTNMIHLANLSVKQNKPDDAITMLQKALAVAEGINVKPKMFQVHQMLSEIYQAKGQMDKSLFHYKAYHEIREQVQHDDNEKKIKNLKLVFEAEQTQKENIIIKKQKAEIQRKNVALQETIDELTLTRINRKAKVITLFLAVVLFIFEDPIVGFALDLVANHSPYISLLVKMLVIFSLSPINLAIQKYLIRKVIKKKRDVFAYEAEPAMS